MYDQRTNQLADVLIDHSTKVQPGEVVLIEAIDVPEETIIPIIRKVDAAGGIPLVELKQNRIQRELIRRGDKAGMELSGDYEIYRMKKVDAYIGIRGSHKSQNCLMSQWRQCSATQSIGSNPSTQFVSHRQNGLSSDIRTPQWHSTQR